MKNTLHILFTFLLPLSLAAQSLTGDQIKQGHAVLGDKVTFIFDETIYGVEAEAVYVTGEFRNWDQSLENPEWTLQKTGNLWLLSFDNPDYTIIRPNSKFKFRINDGTWMDPPEVATNKKGGDLVFLPMVNAPSLKAELLSDGLIWAEVNGKRPLDKASYRLTNAQGEEIPIAGILPNESRTLLIKASQDLDKKRVYFLEIPSLNLKSHCSFDGWFRTRYSSKELGANIDNGRTSIRLFAPRAEEVKVHLYKGRLDENAYESFSMKEDQDGVWEIEWAEDLHGTYYDFTIHGAQDPGNQFYETHPIHFTDPYARVSDDTWGKARIWRRTIPATPLEKGRPKMEDVIAYEVHIQDFTDQLPVKEEHKGTFQGMMTKGLKNSKGAPIGFDYLIDLGINVVHLMPVQEYLHFPTEDWKASFENDPYMIDQGIHLENYQWGYRTSHAMAVESRYRTNGAEPGTERDEFRDLVQAFHDEDIAVIIDIVPNHTAENMDGNGWLFNFNAIDKQYYYRTKDFEHIGAYGNEVKTENRPMTQRWIIDQCKYYMDEFGIDGFRIDLAGQIDEQTLKALREALGPGAIIYGEAWIGSNDPAFEDNPDWDWYKEDAPITFFQDDSRNAYKGPVFELKNEETDRGWPGGKFDERSNVMKGLSNTCKDDKTPLSGISYLDIHDNFALADQFGKGFDGRYDVEENLYKIAASLLYTSMGPIVTHGGSEIMRSKAHAPLGEVVKETKAGYKIYLHGYRDTYNHRIANQFIWEQVGQKPRGKNQNDYANMLAYWKGLNEFRSSRHGQSLRVAEAVPEDYFDWYTPENEAQLGYVINQEIAVFINADSSANTFSAISLPPGQWMLIGDIDQIDINGLNADEGPNLQGGLSGQSLEIPAKSLYIFVRN